MSRAFKEKPLIIINFHLFKYLFKLANKLNPILKIFIN